MCIYYINILLPLYDTTKTSYKNHINEVSEHLSDTLTLSSLGGIGQLIASPTDMIKVRMITDRQMNNPPKYSGTYTLEDGYLFRAVEH